MPVQIGAKNHNFSEPTGLLSDCHRRVEIFMGALQAVANNCDRPLTEETARSLELALRYFRQAAPKHTADEEESLFPRLRKMNNEELDAALTHLETLEQDHRWAEPLHQIVDSLGNEYLEHKKLTEAKALQFRDAVSQLADMYRRHIELEDQSVFPLAARLLTSDQKQKIAAEMAARRNVQPFIQP